jgi:hypothetical protein
VKTFARRLHQPTQVRSLHGAPIVGITREVDGTLYGRDDSKHRTASEGEERRAPALQIATFGESATWAGMFQGVSPRPHSVTRRITPLLKRDHAAVVRVRTINEGMSGRTPADAVSPREQGKFNDGRPEPLPADGGGCDVEL